MTQCCSVGETKAQENSDFACKMEARDALRSRGVDSFTIDQTLARDANFAAQCEMTLESCCLSQHRQRNCNSGRQYAKSGSACMDVELSKQTTLATESFNDCCMACSLGILAARSPGANESISTRKPNLDARCKLSASLQNSFAGLMYERTYIECCQESLPHAPLSSLVDTNAPIDCNQAVPCAQKCIRGEPKIANFGQTPDRCGCFAGYKLAADGFNCLDIDECELNTHSCKRSSEVCDNTKGGFRCLARHDTNLEDKRKTSDLLPPLFG